MCTPIENVLLVELEIKAGVTSYSIIGNELNNRIIHAIQVPRIGNRTRSANDDFDLCSDDTIDSGYIEIVNINNQKILDGMPLAELTISADQPALKKLLFPTEIKGQSTKIKISSDQATADAGKVLQLLFHYCEK